MFATFISTMLLLLLEDEGLELSNDDEVERLASIGRLGTEDDLDLGITLPSEACRGWRDTSVRRHPLA